MGFYFRVFAIFLAWLLFSSFQHNPVTHEAIFLSQLGITPPEQSLTNEKLRETYSENHGRISLTENQDDGKLNTEHKKSCNCEEFCIDARTTELEKILWIENKPIFCREAARIQIKDEQYLAKCFLFCCRQCNLAYYKCAPTNPTGYCLKAAYDCAWKCKKDSLLKITIKGWK